MDRFVEMPEDCFYSVVVGHVNYDMVHPKFLVPRCLAKDKDGKFVYAAGKNFIKSFQMDPQDILDKTVDHWATPSHEYLAKGQDRVVTELKSFLRNKNWKTLLVYHQKECNAHSNQPTYGSHVHIIWRTTMKTPSQDR